MHLSEVFVPYMDPDQSWYWRAYMDSGEYGFGNLMSPLRRGVDCPAYARFLAVTMPQDDGDPMQIADAICMFERSVGDPPGVISRPLGRSPQDPKLAAGRPASELVVRSASAIGNYDYLVDYVFHQDGSIRIAVGATGIDATKGVASQSIKDATATADTRHGTLIAPGLVAPFHSHYFNFRLDLDVDGTATISCASDWCSRRCRKARPAVRFIRSHQRCRRASRRHAAASSQARRRSIISAITMSKTRSGIIPATC
jgi:primary-amine oxidase